MRDALIAYACEQWPGMAEHIHAEAHDHPGEYPIVQREIMTFMENPDTGEYTGLKHHRAWGPPRLIWHLLPSFAISVPVAHISPLE